MSIETDSIDERYKNGTYCVNCYIDDIAKLFVYSNRMLLNQREFFFTGEKKYLKDYMKYKGLFFRLIKELYGCDIMNHYEEWDVKIDEELKNET